MQKQLFLNSILLATLAAVGCSDSTLAPEAAEFSLADAALLADEFDTIAHAALDSWNGPHFSASATGGSLASAAAVPINETFTRTRACPKGGQVTLSGTITGEADRATRTLTTETNATKTQAGCAIAKRDGTVITVSGNPNIAIKVNRKVVNGAPSGLQTTTQKGAFTYSTSTGKTGSCTVDITSTFNPEAKTYTRKGTLCGRTVDVTRTVQRS